MLAGPASLALLRVSQPPALLRMRLPTQPNPTEIVRVLKDISLNVVSAEVDTVGRNAIDRFNVT